MSAEATLYSILSTAAGVTALVSTRIYPDLIPEEKATPYIGYERTSTDPVRTLEGTILSDRIGIMVACWADTRIAAEQLADAVRTAMIGSGWRAESRGAEVDESSGRLAATLQYSVSIAQ
jgi:hypothetical protein